MMAVQAVISMAVFAPGVVAPRIGLDPSTLGLFSTVVFAVAALAAPKSGVLVARLGPMGVVAACCLATALAMLAAAAGSLAGLIAAGALIGFAFGPETPASTTLLGRLTKPARRSFVFSVRQTGNQIGAAIGSVALPALVAVVDPRLGYGLVAVLAGAVAILCWRMAPRYDRTVAAAGASARMPLAALFRSRPLATLALASAAFGAMQLGLNTFFVSHAVTGLGHPHVAAGFALGVAQIAGLAGRLGWGAAVGWIGTPRGVIAGLGIGMTVAAATLALAGPALPFWALVLLAAMFGTTASGWNGLFVAEMARLAPDGRVAETTGAVLTVTYLGLLVGPGLVAATAAVGGLGLSFLVLAGISALGTAALIAGGRP
ncbi:MFS transporter [Hyphomicrobiaceae bacterium 22]|uniref:MFS transporter n=2 Tax=Prosthecodimorpha staleyi TaxID=2840188 RepID=A0A947GCN1_9HYPH|nr:MFS transporter [Prosthecodimorpha staleyi]